MINYLHCLLGLHISFLIDSFVNASFPQQAVSQRVTSKRKPKENTQCSTRGESFPA